MKNKYISSLFVGVFSLGILANCDGGSDTADVLGNVVTVPSNTSIVNDVNTGSSTDTTGANQSLEQTYSNQIFNGINGQRQSRSLANLTRDTSLDAIAATHNAYLISIASPGGSIVTNHDNVQTRANAVFASGFTAYGENTAGIRGYNSSVVASTFVNGWVNSPGHLANIAGSYTRTGVAVAVDSRDGTIFSTQIFVR